jgi:hypothetical protein
MNEALPAPPRRDPARSQEVLAFGEERAKLR